MHKNTNLYLPFDLFIPQNRISIASATTDKKATWCLHSITVRKILCLLYETVPTLRSTKLTQYIFPDSYLRLTHSFMKAYGSFGLAGERLSLRYRELLVTKEVIILTGRG